MRLTLRVIIVAVALTAGPAPVEATVADEVVATSGIPMDEARKLAAQAIGEVIGDAGPYVVGTFNDPPRDPSVVTKASPILLLVGDSRVAPVPGVYSNCLADPPGRAIRCDLRILDDLIDGFDVINLESQRAEMRMRLLRLVLAHELGHVVLGHTGAFYHGAQDGFSVSRYAGYRNELEADAYAVRRVDAIADQRLEYGLVVRLTYQAMKRSLCPDTFPANCPCPGYTDAALCSRIALGPGMPLVGDERFKVALAGTHPEFIVRFARMVWLSSSPGARAYRKEAREVLRRVEVRNEGGRLEGTKALFR